MNSSTVSTPAPGKTFVVPLFLSTSRTSRHNNLFARGALPASTRSRTSTRSVIETATPSVISMRPLSGPHRDEEEASEMYAGSATGHFPEPMSAVRTSEDVCPSSNSQVSGSTRSGSRSTQSSQHDGKRRRTASKRSIRDPRVSAKVKISWAFGITLLVALVIYLALAVTGTATGTMFHVLSILLILSLTGVFCHQLISTLLLIRHPKTSRHGSTHRSRRRHARGHAHTTPQAWAGTHVGAVDELSVEKPIQIHMATDEGFSHDVEAGDQPAIQHPPPVYGNFRTSMRINPDFVHVKPVKLSPLTPTYDEAMIQIHRTMGYRPPSYLSDGGVTEVIESQTRDVEAALENIHPLERERMRTLAAHALEGHVDSRF